MKTIVAVEEDQKMTNEKSLDLIDRKALRSTTVDLDINPEQVSEAGVVNMARALIKLVREAPSIDAVKLAHGRWIWKGGKCFCSVCSRQGEAARVYQDGTVDEYPYCPNCGAKMDLEERV